MLNNILVKFGYSQLIAQGYKHHEMIMLVANTDPGRNIKKV